MTISAVSHCLQNIVLVSGHVDTEQTWSTNYVIICPILGLRKAFYSIKEELQDYLLKYCGFLTYIFFYI
jgi:hypothetical protein